MKLIRKGHFKKGHKVPKEWIDAVIYSNKNKVVSEDTRKKMSLAHKGKIMSIKARKKISDSHSGKKSYFWGKKQSSELIKKRMDARNRIYGKKRNSVEQIINFISKKIS